MVRYNSVVERKFKSNNNVVYSCTYHVIWCPKYRRPVLAGQVESRLKEIITETAVKYESEIHEVEVMPDHVHLVIGVDPQYGIHRLVRQMKGLSSHILRREFPRLKSRLPTLWTNSYFVATVGGAPLAILRQYVENQKHV